MSIFSAYSLVEKIDKGRPLDYIETKILREPWDVDARLIELRLPRAKLMNVVAVARHEAANATPYHCVNAGGTFAYQHGTWSIRNEFVGADWAIDREGNVEAILRIDRKVRVIFSNVDVACNDFHNPKPRSQKGAGAERACMGNLFPDLPTFAPRLTGGELATFYLMLAEDGAAELTRPIVQEGTFSAFIERIYLSTGGEPDGEGLSFGDDDAIVDFDPQVARKR
jgi:hypothetical protein